MISPSLRLHQHLVRPRLLGRLHSTLSWVLAEGGKRGVWRSRREEHSGSSERLSSVVQHHSLEKHFGPLLNSPTADADLALADGEHEDDSVMTRMCRSVGRQGRVAEAGQLLRTAVSKSEILSTSLHSVQAQSFGSKSGMPCVLDRPI